MWVDYANPSSFFVSTFSFPPPPLIPIPISSILFCFLCPFLSQLESWILSKCPYPFLLIKRKQVNTIQFIPIRFFSKDSISLSLSLSPSLPVFSHFPFFSKLKQFP